MLTRLNSLSDNDFVAFEPDGAYRTILGNDQSSQILHMTYELNGGSVAHSELLAVYTPIFWNFISS